LLVTVTLPVTPTVADGAKVKSSMAVCPGVRIWPVETPDAVNPAPEMLTFEIVTLEFPPFVSVTPCTLLVPTLTFPKLRFAVFAFKTEVDGDELGADTVVAEVVQFDVFDPPVTPTQPAWVKLKNKTARRGNKTGKLLNAGTREAISGRRSDPQ
jgi:hypothetical protein